jgi:hypothetical protein
MENYRNIKKDESNRDIKIISEALEKYTAAEKIAIIDEILGYNLEMLKKSREDLTMRLQRVKEEIQIIKNKKQNEKEDNIQSR